MRVDPLTDPDPKLLAGRARDRGEPSGFANLAAPAMASSMRRANRKDLERLKEILE
jgi:hypothetical protein